MAIDIIGELDLLYQELPEVDCKKCGLCCVSPTCTLSEFIYLFDYLQKSVNPEKVKEYILSPPEIHTDCEGNLRCIFLKNNSCAIHAARTGACRLFGIPSLKELKLTNMEECKNKTTVIKGNCNIAFIKSWLDKLYLLEKKQYHYGIEPYFIKGFNIQCWLDIYFDDSLDFDVFSDIKNIMKHYINLSSYEDSYEPKTGLKEKIDKISILTTLLDSGDREAIHKLLLSIRNDYPATGIYFYDETTAFLEVLDKTK